MGECEVRETGVGGRRARPRPRLLQLDPFKETSGVTPVQGIHPDGPVSEKGPSHSCDRFSGSLDTWIARHPPILSDPLYTHLYLKRSLVLARKQANKSKHVFVCFLNGANMVFPVVMYRCESWTVKRLSAEEL